jgi:hypothetical protein
MKHQPPRLPAPPGLLDFTPVPRKKPRHDGWTPERQRAFIAALADTGCVTIAARMVNMSPESAYYLRRQPGAEAFRRAWEAAQSLGLQVVKDEAFDRAMNGQLVPVFVAGKLMGFRRKKNDRLLMFILRHYGTDAAGRKTTVNYFSTKATAGARASSPSPSGEGTGVGKAVGEGPGASASLAAAEASTTTIKTVTSGPPGQGTALARLDEAADILTAFEGVALDGEAQAEIYRTLEACAERRRTLEAAPEDDPDRPWIGAGERGHYLGELESGTEDDLVLYRPDGEHRWEGLGEGGEAAEIDRVVGEMKERLALEAPEKRKRPYKKRTTKPPFTPAEVRQAKARRRDSAAGHEREPDPAGQPAPEGDRTDVTNSVRDGSLSSPEKPRRPYKIRSPKPPFTLAEGAEYEKRKAEATEEAAARKRAAAEVQAKRYRKRIAIKS